MLYQNNVEIKDLSLRVPKAFGKKRSDNICQFERSRELTDNPILSCTI